MVSVSTVVSGLVKLPDGAVVSTITNSIVSLPASVKVIVVTPCPPPAAKIVLDGPPGKPRVSGVSINISPTVPVP